MGRPARFRRLGNHGMPEPLRSERGSSGRRPGLLSAAHTDHAELVQFTKADEVTRIQ